MRALAKIRRWANRDDGKYHQVGNHRLNWLEVVGALLFLAVLLLSQARTALGLSGFWLVALAAIGLSMWGAGDVKNDRTSGS